MLSKIEIFTRKSGTIFPTRYSTRIDSILFEEVYLSGELAQAWKGVLLTVDCTYSNLQSPMLAGVADALLTPYSACTLHALQAFGIKQTTYQFVFSCHGITILTGFGIILMLLVAGTL